MICRLCKRDLPIDMFHKDRTRPGGHSYWCKECKHGKRNIMAEMVTSAKCRARKKGIAHTITLGDIKRLNEEQGGRCKLTGLPMDWDVHPRALRPTNRGSLDRIDHSKGYTLDNVQLVIDVVNRMRQQASVPVFLTVCRLIAARNPE